MSEEAQACTPYINDADELIVPAACEDKYRWWAGGMSVAEIMMELKVSRTVWAKYSPDPYPEELARENYPLLMDTAADPSS
jgi:hypothetical protein